MCTDTFPGTSLSELGPWFMTCMFSISKKCSVYSTHEASDNSAVAKSHPASAGNASPAPKRKPKGRWSGGLQRNQTALLKTLLWGRALEPWGLGKTSALSKEGELELLVLLFLWVFMVSEGSKLCCASLLSCWLSQPLQTPSCFSSCSLHPLHTGEAQPGSDELNTLWVWNCPFFLLVHYHIASGS